jgi:PAS domain S-box-containing protein
MDATEALFQYATEGILVVNRLGKIVRANPSAERMFGYPKGELLHLTIEHLIPEAVRAQHQKHREGFNDNPHPRSMGMNMQLSALRKDNITFPVEVSLSPYNTAEGPMVIAFLIDISIRKIAEDQLKNYNVELEKQVKKRTLILREAIDQLENTKLELNNALEKERELNEMKSRFVSMASHEFRTPLATILSSLSLVTKYGEINEKEKQSVHINKIKSSVNNLTDILNDVLSVSKLDEGKVSFHLEQFDLFSFIEDCVSDLQPIAKEGQQIQFTKAGTSKINFDKKLLKHILFNLVSNAIKFSPEEKPIEVKVKVNKKSWSLIVKDHGIGIPKSDQKHLFERFHRGKNVTNIQGTGLGLNIVARITELLNGTITYDTKENAGTIFTLSFPIV